MTSTEVWRILEAVANDPSVDAEDVRALVDRHFRHPSDGEYDRVRNLFHRKERLWNGTLRRIDWVIEDHCDEEDGHESCGWWLYVDHPPNLQQRW